MDTIIIMASAPSMDNNFYREHNANNFRAMDDHEFENPLSGLPQHVLIINDRKGCVAEPHVGLHISGSFGLCQTVAAVLLLALISVAVSCGTMLLIFRHSNSFAPVSSEQSSSPCVPCPESRTSDMIVGSNKETIDGITDERCCIHKKELVERVNISYF